MTHITNSLEIPRNNSPQIDDLTRDVHLLLDDLSNLFGDMHLSAPSDHSDIGALDEYFGLGQWQRIVFDWHIFDGLTIQDLGLEEDHRIGVANACQEQAFGLNGRAWHDHFDARTMGKVGLNALRVIQCAVTDSARRCSDC